MATLSDEGELVSLCPNPLMSGCRELTPLGESSGTVDLEILSAVGASETAERFRSKVKRNA